MFEMATYSYGFTTIIFVFYYLVCINVCLLLFGVIGKGIEGLINFRMSIPEEILVGYLIYTFMSWWLYKTGNSIFAVPAMLSAAGLVAVSGLVKIRLNGLKANQLCSQLLALLKRLSPFFIIQIVLVVFWVGFFKNKVYHILAFGNNDLYFWGLMADHVMGISDVQRINQGLGASNLLPQVVDCFGVYSWLGLMGKIALKTHSIEAIIIFQTMLMAISSWLIYEISVVQIGVKKVAAFVPAFVFSFNLLWAYIFTNNFLSQLVATFCFLCLINTISTLTSRKSDKRYNIFYGFVFCSAFLFSYPGLLLPYLIVMMGTVGVFSFFISRAKDWNPFGEMTKIASGLIVGILFGAILLYDITAHAINRFFVLSEISAGWVHSMLDPLNMVGLMSYSLDKTVFSNWFMYGILLIVMGGGLLVRNYGTNRRTISELKYDSLLCLSFIALIGYLAVFFIKGESYQQWKFATYFPLPLLILVTVNYFAPRYHD